MTFEQAKPIVIARDGHRCRRCGLHIPTLAALLEGFEAMRLARPDYLVAPGAAWLAAQVGFLAWPVLAEVHHIIAQADGGSHHPDNLEYLCWPDHREASDEQATRRARRKRSAARRSDPTRRHDRKQRDRAKRRWPRRPLGPWIPNTTTKENTEQ